jgi:TetR/AcrR family transcriptional regulator, transcriptional repressor for nem operon
VTGVTESAGLTPKGARTRARIVDAAAALVARRGVAETTVGEVRRSAGVSSSQLYHYFADKDALIAAVVERLTAMILADQAQLDLGTPAGLRAWRDGLVAHARAVSGHDGSALGHLIGQLVESDGAARDELAAGFDGWAGSLRAAMHVLAGAGHLREGVDPDGLGDTLLATLQGGLLLSQVHRDETPLATALDTVLALAVRDDADAPDRPPGPSGRMRPRPQHPSS